MHDPLRGGGGSAAPVLDPPAPHRRRPRPDAHRGLRLALREVLGGTNFAIPSDLVALVRRMREADPALPWDEAFQRASDQIPVCRALHQMRRLPPEPVEMIRTLPELFIALGIEAPGAARPTAADTKYRQTIRNLIARRPARQDTSEKKSPGTMPARTCEHRGGREYRPAASRSTTRTTSRASSSSDGSDSPSDCADPPLGRDLSPVDPGPILAAIRALPLPANVRLRVLWSLPESWQTLAWAQLAANTEATR